ncbi:MAG: type II toxin-antitoxin system VapC family toxin [Alphaproteobacteria bacterium]|nr:type II toxin-antitoxin system VapC family toxin [Alphaproteobacteria bacterium]
MRVLLDTNVLLRALIEPDNLASKARSLIENPDNVVLFSATSIWEIAIKSALGKADFHVTTREILDAAIASGFEALPIRSAAALGVSDLPAIHRDPFDRLLIAQALHEPARLMTTDAALAAYSELVVCV